MKPAARLSLRTLPRLVNPTAPSRLIHSTVVKPANVAPILGTGPPPDAPPAPGAVNAYHRVERRRRQAELLKNAKHLRDAKSGKVGGMLKKRFWKNVSVHEVDGALQVYLDERPLRHPQTKEIIRLPTTKPHLASALALEWDLLSSAQEATKQHLIPLTSLVCRALDIQADDNAETSKNPKIRDTITTTVLRYMDTDSLLCWAPPAGEHDIRNDAGESLRDVQKQTADEIVSFLTANVWPGIKIEPVLDGDSIVPRQQEPGVREVVQSWISGLDAWEITGLERATLAGKSFLVAARVVAGWTESAVGVGLPSHSTAFGAEQAAKACSLEVDWQATQWGEVEDTHDVNNEDVRRQLASVVLLVSGTGKA